MRQLVISDDEGKTTIVPLDQGEMTIGRAEENKIRLPERNVSRKHARLVPVKGSVWIEDLGSYNGVKVNGARIAGKHALRVRDQIQIGDYRITLTSGAVARATDDSMTGSFRPVADAETRMIAMPGEATTQMAIGPAHAGARLVPVSPASGRPRLLDRDEIVLGSADGCGVVLRHRSVSAEHAKILRVNQVFRILDLDSTNGVRVNGREVRYAELDHGDEIALGEVVLRFEVPGTIAHEGTMRTRMPGHRRARPQRLLLWAMASAAFVIAGIALGFVLRSPPSASSPPPALGARAGAGAPLLPPPAGPRPDEVNARDPRHEAQALRDRGELEAARRAAVDAKARFVAAGESTTDVDNLIAELDLEIRGKTQLAQARTHLPDAPEAAFAAMELIPGGTVAYDDPIVVQTTARVLSSRVDQGRSDLAAGTPAEEIEPRVEEVLGHPRVREATAPELVAVRSAAQTLLHEIESADRPRTRVVRVRPAGNGHPDPPAKVPPPTKAPPATSSGEAAEWRQIRTLLTAGNRTAAKPLACRYAARYPGTPNGRQATGVCRSP